jgi:DNA-binding transcriptional ArsR family regulator
MSKEDWNLGIPPDDILIIDNLETLKVIADPLRLKILELLRGETQTVKQLAAALNTPLK